MVVGFPMVALSVQVEARLYRYPSELWQSFG